MRVVDVIKNGGIVLLSCLVFVGYRWLLQTPSEEEILATLWYHVTKISKDDKIVTNPAKWPVAVIPLDDTNSRFLMTLYHAGESLQNTHLQLQAMNHRITLDSSEPATEQGVPATVILIFPDDREVAVLGLCRVDWERGRFDLAFSLEPEHHRPRDFTPRGGVVCLHLERMPAEEAAVWVQKQQEIQSK